ncbi:hypothetical protein JQC72_11515 [Polycladomyces sp. WAk]|uniref:Uncharacterized protein n=1 Tax=Polycladomyces zharkentensis TaxID=2807616 RepID=A0ABS2WKS7_9BACL|nr:hypothetical protein [Polycladomyces sp. WAk]MBN2910129.1 hypothetical protein [Polycladomyces sp. WAk]
MFSLGFSLHPAWQPTSIHDGFTGPGDFLALLDFIVTIFRRTCERDKALPRPTLAFIPTLKGWVFPPLFINQNDSCSSISTGIFDEKKQFIPYM